MVIRDPRGIPSREEERWLLEMAQSASPGDEHARLRAEQARNELAERHHRFIVMRARRFSDRSKRPDLLEDFEQEAALGFLEAVDLFEIGRDVKLVTYAAYHCDRRLRKFLKDAALVHVPQYLERAGDADPDHADPPPTTALQVQCRAAAREARAPLVRLDGRLDQDAPETAAARDVVDAGQLDPAELLIEEEDGARLRSALGRINPALREILVERFGIRGECETYQAIGRRFKVCREWVRRLEQRALEELFAEFRACARPGDATARQGAA